MPILLGILAIVVGAYAAEIAIANGLIQHTPITARGYPDVVELGRRAAARRGVPYDDRPLSAVIADARANGEHAFPLVSPAYFATPAQPGSTIIIDGRPVLPIGAMPHASNYYCNESGTFARFDTDRMGLRNPDQVWDVKAIEVLLVGDSFTFGSCLPNEQSIAGRIRAEVPNTINAGSGAIGPLFQLAAIREIVGYKRPRRVFWLFFENDFDDMQRERKNPILSAYIDPEFSQGLKDKMAALEAPIKERVEGYYAIVKGLAHRPQESVWRLPRVRSVLVRRKLADQPAANADFDFITTILTRARDDIVRAGGELIFVYIPDCNPATYHREKWRSELLQRVSALQVPVIDTDATVKAMAARGPKPYFYCPSSHFSEAGAAAVAGLILKSLNR